MWNDVVTILLIVGAGWLLIAPIWGMPQYLLDHPVLTALFLLTYAGLSFWFFAAAMGRHP